MTTCGAGKKRSPQRFIKPTSNVVGNLRSEKEMELHVGRVQPNDKLIVMDCWGKERVKRLELLLLVVW